MAAPCEAGGDAQPNTVSVDLARLLWRRLMLSSAMPLGQGDCSLQGRQRLAPKWWPWSVRVGMPGC